MKNLFSNLILALCLSSALICSAQQEKNPNQQQQQTGAKNQPPPENPGQNTPSQGQTNPDVPQQKPGTNNPDIAPDSKPTASDTGTASKNKKSRRRKGTTASTHTAPTA